MPVFRLTFPYDDWSDRLWDAIDLDDPCADRPYLGADLVFENPVTGEAETFEDVGVRYRGHSALDLGDGERVGFKIDVGEYVEDRLLHGVERVNLLGTEGDLSLVRENLALEMLRDLGVPAPRTGWAILYVNDVLQGVFPNTEEPDDQAYLDSHFDDPDGHLYKVAGYCGPTVDFAWWGEDPAEWVDSFEPKAGTDPEDLSTDLIPMVACVEEPDDAAFAACIEAWIDVDTWLLSIAADNVFPDVDGMPNAGQNFMLYFEPSAGLFHLYPWDKDLALDTNNALEGDAADIWSVVATWRPEYRNLLVERLQQVYPRAYCDAVLQVAESYDPDVFEPHVRDLQSFLTPWVDGDPFLDTERWGWMVDDILEVVEQRHPLVVEQATACAR